jgi:hypothetical protein
MKGSLIGKTSPLTVAGGLLLREGILQLLAHAAAARAAGS